MKPAPFRYHRPQQLDEVYQLLDEYQDQAKIIAGGQSLVPVLNMRLARTEHLIDINRLNDLCYIREEQDHIRIGALTRHMMIEQSPLIQEKCPIVAAAAQRIGYYAIRQRGTIGGSLVHADPSAEFPLMAVLLDSSFHIGSSDGERVVPARDFFLTVYMTDIAPNEVFLAADFPVFQNGEGWSYQEFARRAGDFALVSVGSTVRMNSQGEVEHLRIAVGGVDSVPWNAADIAEDYLHQIPTEDWMESLSQDIAREIDANADMHASEIDRKELTVILTKQSLRESIERASRKGAAT